MESFVHITWFLTKYFDYSFNSLGSKDNNHKREVGKMEDAMKYLENKSLGFEKKNGHHYYIGWDEIYEGIIRVDYHLTVPQMESLSLK